MNTVTMPGYGDAATWSPCDGHPHDPRTPEVESGDSTADVIDGVREWLSMAEIYAAKGDMDSAKKALYEAMLSLEEVVGVWA